MIWFAIGGKNILIFLNGIHDMLIIGYILEKEVVFYEISAVFPRL